LPSRCLFYGLAICLHILIERRQTSIMNCRDSAAERSKDRERAGRKPGDPVRNIDYPNLFVFDLHDEVVDILLLFYWVVRKIKDASPSFVILNHVCDCRCDVVHMDQPLDLLRGTCTKEKVSDF